MCQDICTEEPERRRRKVTRSIRHPHTQQLAARNLQKTPPIEQLDPYKPKTEEEKNTANQAFKEALISYYTSIAVNTIHEKAEGEICYLDATAGIGILPLHIKNNLYPIFGSAIG